MTLVIGLQAPVLGYCAAEDTLVIVDHFFESDSHQDCDHDEVPEPAPCEDDHEFLTVDAGDFQWSPLHLDHPPMVLVAEDFICEAFTLISVRELRSPEFPEHDPPPPGLPIFRRDGVLRL